MAWIRDLEKKNPDKILIGVYISTKGDKLELTPMWRDE